MFYLSDLVDCGSMALLEILDMKAHGAVGPYNITTAHGQQQ